MVHETQDIKFKQYYKETQKSELKFPEILSFIFAGVGDSFCSGAVNIYFLIFSTTVMGINPMVIGTLLLVTRIIDACFDPMVGILVDNTRTRFGKLRPYILMGGVMFSILTLLLFTNIQTLSQSLKTVYICVVYILFGIAFSCIDVPYWSFSTVITKDSNKRNTMVSITRSATVLGETIISIFGGFVINYFADFPNSGQGYTYMIAIFSALALISFITFFLLGKERVQPSAEKISFKEIVLALKVNRPLQLVIINQLIIVGASAAGAFNTFVARYNLGDIRFLAVLSLPVLISFFISPVLIPKLLVRFNKEKLYLYVSIVAVSVNCFLYFMGYSNLILLFICLLIYKLCYASAYTINSIAFAESVDYAEWKTGKRLEGVTFAIQSFIAKVRGALGGFLTSWVLVLIGFQAKNTVQTSGTLNGLFFSITVLASISLALSSIPHQFNKFKGDYKKTILNELEERRKAS